MFSYIISVYKPHIIRPGSGQSKLSLTKWVTGSSLLTVLFKNGRKKWKEIISTMRKGKIKKSPIILKS